MKQYLKIAATIAIAATASASAAQDFSGFYIGAGASNSEFEFDDGRGFQLGMGSVGASLYAGYNYQLAPNFVVGIEAKYDSSDASTFWFPTSIDNLSGVSAQVGYVIDKVMVYGSIGTKNATMQPSARPFNLGPPLPSLDEKMTGVSVGAGVEYFLNDSISVKGEYTRTDFGLTSGRFFPPSRLTLNSISIGAAVHF